MALVIIPLCMKLDEQHGQITYVHTTFSCSKLESVWAGDMKAKCKFTIHMKCQSKQNSIHIVIHFPNKCPKAI